VTLVCVCVCVYVTNSLNCACAQHSDKKRDIRREAENTIGEFLRDLKVGDPAKVDFTALIAIIAPYTSSQGE
jgi:hypothetical protein